MPEGATAPTDRAHLERVRREVNDILSGLSGLDPEDLDPDATFLELGFESLSLTQVSMAVKQEFEVNLGFRDLLESHRTPAALAERLAGDISPERLAPDDEGGDEADPATGEPTAPAAESSARVENGAPRDTEPGGGRRQPRRAMEAEFAGDAGQDRELAMTDERTHGENGDRPEAAMAGADAAGLERVILEQIRMMNHQLDLLRDGRPRTAAEERVETAPVTETVDDERERGTREPEAAVGTGADDATTKGDEETDAERQETSAAGPEAEGGADTPAAGEETDDEEERHGPWQPMDHDRDDGLTPRQREHVQGLVDRVEERMPASKRFTQEHRRHLADPRTVEGFRRAWKEVVHPVVADRSRGAHIWDVDGNRYVDAAMGFGVALLGHHPPFIREAIRNQLEDGFAIGPQTPLAGEVARLVHELTGMERVAFCNTGSEAVLAALRTARTVTGRDRIATFRGDYHGIFDEVLARGVEIGGESRTMPIAPGIPPRMVQGVTMLDYGEESALERIREEADELAAVLVEPVQSRHPDLQPAEFVRRLRALTEELDVPLILDEMITGFRSHPGGIQALWDVEADIVTYGKVAGGGMPIGIVTGKSRFLDALDGGHWRYGDDSIPEAGVTWFAGTFVRHPLSLAAARATLQHLKDRGPALQEELNRRTAAFVDELNERFQRMGAPLHVENFASLFLVDFLEGADAESLFYFHLRARGVHITEGRAAFLSTAHSEEDVEHLLEAFTESARALQEGGFLPGGAGDVRELPLTEGQKEIWLATQVGEDASCAFNLSNAVRLEGEIDAGTMREAVRRLVDRHEALRTTFDPEGPSQRIQPSMNVDVPVVDLSVLDPDEREQRLEALRKEEVETPFDLERGPLFRARLIRLRPDEHLLFFTAHHIVCDGWSCGVLLRNLGQIYPALREGREPELPEPTQLSEYVGLERKAHESPAGKEAEEYWLDRLRDGTPVVELPTDRPRPPTRTYAADRVELEIGRDTHAEIKKAAAERGATTFALLHAAFEALLHRLTGQEDLVVGVSAAGQAMFGRSELVGHCVNMLPVRNRVEGDRDFSEHLDDTRSLLLDAFDHQRCTFGSLLEKLDLERDASRTPLVSVVFNLDPTLSDLDFGGLDVSARSNPRSFEIFDLFFNAVVSPDAFRLECTFNTDLLDRETVSAWLRHYRRLLEGAVSDPDRPVRRMPLMRDEERHRVLVEWNDTDRDYPDGVCIHERIEEQVDRTPDRVAVSAGDEDLGYRQLDERANRLARCLLDRGIDLEDRVGVAMDRSTEMVVALLGVLKAGGAYVPLDPSYPAERLSYMADDADIRLLLTQASLEDEIPNLGVPTIRLDADRPEIEAYATDRPDPGVDETSLAYVMYTSGSTGRPKGVMVEHRHVHNRLQWGSDVFPLEPGDTVLQKTPFSFDVSVPEFFWTLSSGARLVMARPGGHKDPDYLARLIERESATYIHFVPSMLEVFLEEDGLDERCRSLRWVVCSGEALSYPLTRRFFQRMPDGVELHNLYGPTEAAVEVSRWQVPRNPDDRVVPIGRPVANTQLYVLDGELEPVPIGVPGELHIGGAQVVRGYRNRPERTREQFVPDPFRDDPDARLYRTGDRVRWRRDGTLEFLGRLDRQVKLRGFRIELGEIESVLTGYDGVNQAAVDLHEETDADPELVAYIVAEPGRNLVVEDLREALARRLPEYMVPARFVALEALPLTPSGKVDRKALPAPDGGLVSKRKRRPASPPETDTERHLASLWSELLGTERVGADDDFFDLGGHSLMATRLLGRVEEQMNVRLPLRTIFEHPTLRALAEQIDAAGAEKPDSPDSTPDTSKDQTMEEITL